MRIVLDTNVLVSGLLNPNGAPGRIVSLIGAQAFQILHDPRIIDEYTRVLLRPKFGFAKGAVDELIAILDLLGETVTASPLPTRMRDPDDAKFLEVAVAGKAEWLVTGNTADFPARFRRVRTTSPARFVDRHRG